MAFSNGLTRSSNTVTLGGALTADTRIYDGTYEYIYFDTTGGNVGIGNSDPTALFTVGTQNPFTVSAAGLVTLGNIVGVTDPYTVLVADGNGVIRSLSTTGWDRNGSDDLVLTTNFGGDVSGTYNNIQIGTGVVGANELASTTVAAGSYGSVGGTGAFIPVLTVDQDGRITGASTVIFSLPPSENPLTFGEV